MIRAIKSNVNVASNPVLASNALRVCFLLRTVPCAIFALVLTIAATAIAEEPKVKHGDNPKDDTPNVKTLFDGKSLKNWRIAKINDFESHGKVYVKDGAVVLEKGKPASGIVYTGKPPRMNYQLSLDAKRIAGSDFFCGLTFPVNKSYCTLIIGGWGGGSTGLSNVDEASAIDNETTGYTEFKQNQWYNIRLRVTEKKIEAWIDKEQIVELDSGDRKFSIWWEQEPARPLGIATWNTTAALRNIRLQELAAPVKALSSQTDEKQEED